MCLAPFEQLRSLKVQILICWRVEQEALQRLKTKQEAGKPRLSPVSGNPMDDDTADSHGTHVAGIIGAVANNSLGVAGVNWRVRMMAIKFLHGPEGFGELADALKGVEYAIANGAKIIN